MGERDRSGERPFLGESPTGRRPRPISSFVCCGRTPDQLEMGRCGPCAIGAEYSPGAAAAAPFIGETGLQTPGSTGAPAGGAAVTGAGPLSQRHSRMPLDRSNVRAWFRDLGRGDYFARIDGLD
jgi:hypothetical protein